MRSKVSMVVPCYNKEAYIGDMLRSVYKQIWDNIEVILVNDGSTDGTRQVIAEWEPRLRERFELIVVDQENAGCCAAVHSGMLRMTGDYFCLVDCDDEIMPEYVSKMAGWLDDNPDYDMAACNYASYRGSREKQILNYVGAQEYTPEDAGFLENFLLCRIFTGAWIYMSRRERAIRIVEGFCAERRKTYEPCIVIPLAAGAPKLKFFREPLYKFNLYANGFVGFKDFEQAGAYYEDYNYLHSWAINRLETGAAEKRRLIAMGELGCLKREVYYTGLFPEREKTLALTAGKITKFLDKAFSPPPRIAVERIINFCNELIRAAEENILGGNSGAGRPEYGVYDRIIGYGALGKSAERKLGRIAGTRLEPAVLWDAAAEPSSEVCGKTVKQPGLDSLTERDLVIILPGAKEAREEIAALLEAKGFDNIIMYGNIHPFNYFPEFYGECRFVG